MSLFRDIKSKRLLHAKGFLFLLIGLLAGGTILFESQNLVLHGMLWVGAEGK